MPAATFEYAVIRVVPRVERQEFVNVGVVLSYPAQNFLQARIEPDWTRLQSLAPYLDLAMVKTYLEVIPRVCAGGEDAGAIGKLPQRARFHWLVAPRSTLIQTSPVHSGVCDDPQAVLEHLLNEQVRPPQ